MTDVKEKLFINENGVISLQIKEDFDLELASILYINTSNNQKLEIKYPNLNKLNSTFLLGNNYLKNLSLKVKPNSVKSQSSLCQSVLGIYPNLANDPIAKTNRLVIQAFVPHKILFYQDVLKIGDLLLSINDIDVTYENIESILVSIKEPQKLKIKALGPITYANLNTLDLILNNEFPDLIRPKENKNTIFVPSKSTKVVKGDRVKAVNQPVSNDDLFFYAMILSLDQGALKRKQNSKEKNDLVYVFPNDDSQYAYKKQNNLILAQVVEVIRGLFMTLSYAVKDIDNNDKAICSSIDFQGESFNVCFLHDNFGKKGLLVLIAPNEQINQNYFKTLSKSLNQTYKFTFGNSTLTDLVCSGDDLNSQNKTKSQLDAFFNNFHRRLIQSSQFNFFDPTYTVFNLTKPILNFQDKIKCYDEMRAKIFDSIPFFELPTGLKIDLETVMSDLESQESNDIDEAINGFRRHFFVTGSCLFFQNYLLVSHFDEILTKQVYNYCDVYNLFGFIRNGNTTHFRIWKEVELNDKLAGSRHFMIIVGLKDFIGVMIIESGGAIAKEIDEYKIVEPNPLYIQKVLYMLLDLDNSGLMLEVNQHFASKTPKIIFDMDKFLTTSKKREKLIHKKRSYTRSPIRFKDQNQQRSLSRNGRSQSPNRGFKENADNLVKDSGDENSLDEFDPNNEKIYQTKSLTRYNSISDLGRVSLKNANLTNIENENRIFNDLSLTNSILYYASSETRTNGILFTPKNFNLNSSLFTRFFYNYVNSCFKIKNLFDNYGKIDKRFGIKNENCYEVIEQGVLFNLFVDEDRGRGRETKQNENKSKQDVKKLKELNFWVVGRRKFQRVNSNSEWVNLGDFFICFHDNLEDVVLELAFDIGFAKMSY